MGLEFYCNTCDQVLTCEMMRGGVCAHPNRNQVRDYAAVTATLPCSIVVSPDAKSSAAGKPLAEMDEGELQDRFMRWLVDKAAPISRVVTAEEFQEAIIVGAELRRRITRRLEAIRHKENSDG